MSGGTSYWRRTAVVAISLAVLCFGSFVMAQEEQTEDAVIDEAVAHALEQAFEEEITVTGTLIPRPTLDALSPVNVLGPEEITYGGVTRIEDLMATMPQAFAGQNSTWANGATGTATVDLRNIGSQRTLVLINGRRMAPGSAYGGYAPDLNTIPAFMLKRVDVLTGGASSTYGNDAVAGVVNFIIDDEFEGMKADVQYSFYQHNNNNGLAQRINQDLGFDVPTGSVTDGDGVNIDLAFGGKFADGRGHASAYIGYRQMDPVIKGQRDYTNCSVAGGDAGPECGGSPTTDWGTFIDGNGDWWMVDPNQDQHGFSPWDHVFNYASYNHIQRPDERWNAGSFLKYEFNQHAEGYMELMFMNDETDAQIAPSGAFGVTNTINCDNPMMSDQQRDIVCTSQGYGPDDTAPLLILRRNVEGGARNSYIRHTNYRIVAGLRGDINDTWAYDAYGLFAQTNYDNTYENDLDITRIVDALDVIVDPDTGEWVCRSGNAGCAPYNVFQTGGVTQEAIDYIYTRLVSFGTTRTEVLNATFTGDLGDYGWALSSANEGVQIALGAGYRREFLERIVDEVYRTGNAAGQGGPYLPVEGTFNVMEGFTELLIPFVQDAPMARDLSAELGYRYSDYSTSGGVSTYKAMLSWAPTKSFGFRGGINRAIRAPNIFELFVPAGFGLGGSEDMCAGPNPTGTLEECMNTGVTADQYGNVPANPANQYNDYSGGNPNLDPETADTLTFGVVFTPEALPGFTATLDYYDIDITDLIDQFAFNDIMTTCAQTGDPALCGLIHRGPTGDLWYHWANGGGYIETTQQNVGDLYAKGIDMTASYMFGMGDSGFLSTDVTGTYVLENAVSNPLRAYDCVGFYGYQCGQPNPTWKHRARVTWETNFNASFSLMWRYIGSTEIDDASSDPDLGNTDNMDYWRTNGVAKTSAFNYIDLSGTYNFTDNVQFTLGINNILDKEPPLYPDIADDQYVNTYATFDPLGRYVHMSLRFTF